MVKRVIKRTLLWVAACYLVIALGFGYGYGYANGSGNNDPTVTVEGVQAGLSWPWLVAQSVTDHPS